jgi:hypothetical protein
VEDRFRGRIGRSWERLLPALAAGAVPHHSFHVFAVYPWLGLLRTGRVEEPLHVLDRCRIAPAVVQAVEGDSARVLVRPLLWSGHALELGPYVDRTVRWRDDGRGLIDELRPGDRVALHWDFACDRLTAKAALGLDRVTRRALRAVNGSSTSTALA